MSAKRFRVAFSFAGERRDYVAKVAERLAVAFGKQKVLYDKYHQAELARRNLGIYLPELYHKESDLIVVVACPDYDVKDWTGLEWTAIHDLLSKRRDDEVMLCRFGRASLTGLYETAGFLDLDDKSPEEAAALILERLTQVDERAPRVPARSPVLSSSTPNNLPRLESFFGREEELKTIREALDPESRTWGALIDGPGGMGKTSLAVRAAYDCPPGQFQRIIFVSVKDRELDDDGVRRLGTFVVPGFLEMLNELARELEKPDIPKAPESQRIRLLLEALRPERALLILDNLESLAKEDRDQLLTLVKRLPQGCKAILTSRRRLGSGSELLILEKLDQAAALETLADLAGRNPLLAKTNEAERLTLYQQTGGKPLLLRWVAGQLGRGSCRTFTDALTFLRTCPPDNDPLEFIFGDLARDFTHDETAVLCTLTYFTLPAKVEHVASVAGVDEVLTETALRTLANRSLVVPDQEESAFSLVPMVADFLRRAQPEVISKTGARLEKRAYALILQNGDRHYERFATLDAAWPTVAPALRILLAGPNSRLQSVCDKLVFFLEFTGRWDEQLSLCSLAEIKAVATEDLLSAGWRAYQAGWIHFLREEADAVLTCAGRAKEHWQTSQASDHERASVGRLHGIGLQLKGDYAAALAVFRQSLELWRAISPESEDVAAGLTNLGSIEDRLGDRAAAERTFREALRVSVAISYTDGVATHTGNLAELARVRQDWSQCEKLSREALLLSEQIGRQELIAVNSKRIAEALLEAGRPDEALPFSLRAIEILRRLGSPGVEDALAVARDCESRLSTILE
jgi:tetratricopeptide (TPR) repeat protein